MEVINRIKAYLRKKEIETVEKNKQDTVKLLIKIITTDKTINQQIELINKVTIEVNNKLERYSKDKLKDLEHIEAYFKANDNRG